MNKWMVALSPRKAGGGVKGDSGINETSMDIEKSNLKMGALLSKYYAFTTMPYSRQIFLLGV